MDKHVESDRDPILKISGLNAFYGESHVLHGCDLEVRKGEVVTLIGNNGAGKTTLLRSILALVDREGSILYDGKELTGLKTEAIAKLGIGYVPEERNIFATLSVKENLMLPPQVKPGGLTVDDIFQLFPNLLEHISGGGSFLSGGEQQMLSIARIMRTGADFILLDEPMEGLAPVLVEKIGEAIEVLKETGYTIVLVEQNFRFVRNIADRHYLVENGYIVDMIPNDHLDRPEVFKRLDDFLGV